MSLSIPEARQLFAKVEALGGTVPAELLGLVNLETRVRNVGVSVPKFPLDDLVAATTLTDVDLSAEVHESAIAIMVDTARGDLLRRLDVQIPAAIKVALTGPLGDALFDSLRPIVAKHVEGINRVGEALPEDVTAAQVLELGDKAADAWREGPKHAQALDEVLWRVVLPIATEVVTIDPTVANHGQARFVLHMVDLDFNPSPDGVAKKYTTGREKASRFGGWRALLSAGPLRLNAPSEVQAYLNGLADTAHEDAQANYERNVARPISAPYADHVV